VAHLAFGHGVHRCIGAQLAKLELEVAFRTLLERLPTLRPARAESQLWWKNGLLTVGPIALPVLW
jgi:cytochrome P450